MKNFKNLNREIKEITKVDMQKIVNSKTAALATSLSRGIISKEDFLKAIEVGIELPKEILDNPTKIFALNYDCKSMVGIWTIKATAICSANPEEFVNEDGNINKNRYRKAFPGAILNGQEEKYESIFEDNINVINFKLALYREYSIKALYVSNKEIDEFAYRVNHLDLNKATLEDIKRIQKDLWALFRAWQESSIDMTKDKSKAFNTSMDDVLGKISVRTDMKFNDISINEHDIKRKKYSNEEIPQLEISFEEYDSDENDFIETKISDSQHDIRCEAEPVLRGITKLAIDANNGKFARYRMDAKMYPELALTVNKIFKLIRDCRRENGENKIDLKAADYALYRAIIYKDATNEDMVDMRDVVKVALGAAGCNVYANKAGNVVVDEFDEALFSRNIFMVEKIFGNILVAEKAQLFEADHLMHGNSIMMELEVRHVVEDVNNGIYDFEDGVAYDNSGEMLFDTTSELSGKALVNDNGAYLLYDPLREINDIPEFDFIFVSGNDVEAEEDDENKGEELFNCLEENMTYTLRDNEMYMDDKYGECHVATVEDIYAVDEDMPQTRIISKWYGTVGGTYHGERLLKRNNIFCILSYDSHEMQEYVNSITCFVK